LLGVVHSIPGFPKLTSYSQRKCWLRAN
jgi:hypothetical protein